jgi:multiple sugar transport system permease protein
MMKSTMNTIVTYGVLSMALLIVLIPFVWGTANAFRSNEEISALSGINKHTFFPEHVTLQNFQRMFTRVNLGRVLLNTVFVSLTVTIANLLLNAMAGYAFARFDFPGKTLLFMILVATLIIPVEVLIIPLYMTIKDLHLMDSYAALILPFSASAFGIFFMRQFILGIPKEFDEAAFIDGATHLDIFWRILLPLTRPAMVTLGVIVFLQQWDSFIVPVTVISSEGKMVLQVALQKLQFGLFANDWGILFAGMVVAAFPVIIVFLFLQKYYVEGVSSSGIKG